MIETIEYHGGVTYKVTHAEDPQQIYDQVNAKFFAGALSRYRVVYEDDRHRLPEFDDGEWVLGGVLHEEKLIILRSPQSRQQLISSLKHEAVHIFLRNEPGDPHGEAFRRELRRVSG